MAFCTLHRAAEHDPLFELLRDRVGDKLRVGLGLADFFDVDVNRHAHQALQIRLQTFDVLAALADHNTRAGGVNRNACILGGTLDDHSANGSALELLLEVFTDADIGDEHRAEILVICIPLRTPVTRHCEAKPNRVNFLTHRDSLGSDLHSNVAGLLFDLVAAALGPCGEALHRLGLVHINRGDLEFVDIGAVVVFGIRDGRFNGLLEDACGLLVSEGQDV